MRILHFLHCSGYGGDALAALLVARGQIELGHDVEVVIEASPHAAGFLQRAASCDVPAREAPLLAFQSLEGTLPRSVKALRTFGSKRCDIFHYHSCSIEVRRSDVLAAQVAPARARVVTVQAGHDWSFFSDPAEKMARWRRGSLGFQRVICPSRPTADIQALAGVERQMLVIVPNPVDQARVASGDGSMIRSQLGINEEDVVVLFCSRLDVDKRPLDALRAFASVSEREPRARMLLAGSGQLERECEETALALGVAHLVTFLGYRTDVPDVLNAADIFVLPTNFEAFPLAVVEAMAAGLAIVTTPALVDAGAVIDGATALVCPPGDLAALSETLGRLVADPVLRRELAAKARVAAEPFDIKRVAEQLLELYEEVLRERRSSRLSSIRRVLRD